MNRSWSISFRCKRSHRDLVALSWLKILQNYPSRIVNCHTAYMNRKWILSWLSEEHSVPQKAAIVILARKGLPLNCHTSRFYSYRKDTWCTAWNYEEKECIALFLWRGQWFWDIGYKTSSSFTTRVSLTKQRLSLVRYESKEAEKLTNKNYQIAGNKIQ